MEQTQIGNRHAEIAELWIFEATTSFARQGWSSFVVEGIKLLTLWKPRWIIVGLMDQQGYEYQHSEGYIVISKTIVLPHD
jgi:hypothetical protein